MADNHNNENNHEGLHQLQTESLAKLYKEEQDMSRKIEEIVSKHVTKHFDLCRQDLEEQLMKTVETLKSEVLKDVEKRMETLNSQLNEGIMQVIQQAHGMNFLGGNEDANSDGSGEDLKGFGDPKEDGGGQSSS